MAAEASVNETHTSAGKNRQRLTRAPRRPGVTPEVRRTDPEGVDYGWVMQVTFVVTIVVGAPVVALLSVPLSLPTWPDRAVFAIRVGAVVWLVTAVSTYLYARRHQGQVATD
jgi:hypothetical protein